MLFQVKTLCPCPSLLTTACPQADGTAQEMLSTATGSPNALNVTKFQRLKSKYIKNRVENQWLHILVVTARTCWYKSEYWFYQFTSNNSQLVHSNHTGYWIHASAELCSDCFWTAPPPFPKMPKELPTLCFFPLPLQRAPLKHHRFCWDESKTMLMYLP